MPVLATDGTIEREFTCEQVALMGGVPSGWTVIKNTCGIYLYNIYSPYASFGLEITGNVVTGSWYIYEGTVSSDEVAVPTGELLLPSDPRNVRVTVRRQMYHPSEPGKVRDFSVDTALNKIVFTPGRFPSLNGQKATVEVFK